MCDPVQKVYIKSEWLREFIRERKKTFYVIQKYTIAGCCTVYKGPCGISTLPEEHLPGMNPAPLNLHHFKSAEDNFDIYIEDECMKSKFFEHDEQEFNLEGYAKFIFRFKDQE